MDASDYCTRMEPRNAAVGLQSWADDIIISLVFPFWFVSFPMYPPTVQEIANCLRPSAPETTDMMQARQEVEAELRARQVRAVWTVFREVWEGLGSDLVNN